MRVQCVEQRARRLHERDDVLSERPIHAHEHEEEARDTQARKEYEEREAFGGYPTVHPVET